MIKHNIDWIIHCCRNGIVCSECNEVENGFLENMCNAHTHGMSKYGHMDFQLVIQYSDEKICYLLNRFGLKVQQGWQFRDGDTVTGIFEDCDIRLKEFDECGRKVLCLIIPDEKNMFPDDEGCSYPYSLQNLPTDMLWSKGGDPA